jgi:urease accessory protein
MLKHLLLATFATLALIAPAFAHLNPGEHGSFPAGLSHPASGSTTSLRWLRSAFRR